MNRKKRLLPLLMALLLIVSYLPVMRSYAAECIVRGDNHTPWNSCLLYTSDAADEL